MVTVQDVPGRASYGTNKETREKRPQEDGHKKRKSVGLTCESIQDDYMFIDGKASAANTFSALSIEEAHKRAANFSEHSTLSFKEKASHEGWKDVDEVHYILCGKDNIIPPPGQQGMVDMMEGTGQKVKVWELKESDHAPMESFPDELVEVLGQIIE